MSEEMKYCRCCMTTTFSLGFTALFLWIGLRTSSPAFSIQNFSVPALNTTSKTNTTTVAIDFRIENTNNEKGVYYDALNVTLYYAPNLSSPVGKASISEFYQGYKKKAIKHATFQDLKIPWGAAMKTVSLNKTVGFRVDLATEVRYKIFRWKTGRHKIRVHGDVSVDKQGKKTHKKPIKLKSAAPNSSGHRTCFYGFMVFLFVLLGPEFVEISLLF
ncbi:hypothetical protein NE237_001226 [Protea cynaroides]|uniref:Late embryogenesis abundant protein LEA-2 subgroup domain-containing protein n=1 Tax=Protea cynaroides TaxID=273540 RepID=A0A9Q0QXW0_9MAGN|nr:hypothetical protein NE237_001226 [Protea cynaroides]